MCSTNRVTVIDTYQYNDAADDFNREPYCVKFGLQNAGMPAIDHLVQAGGSFFTVRQHSLLCRALYYL